MQTFLWHDYETFGSRPRLDRPAQFAAVRTDAELNQVGAPIDLFCQPSPDYLPEPQACLITGITPQQCLAQGLPEYQFAAQIEVALSQPGTIGVGYNTIRFDDEFTRYLFWRNLIDPYAREWQNGCGRWDLMDAMRAAYALRPDGIEWPLQADGKASFKLEHLSAANGLEHEAHSAMSDVHATLGLARRLRQAQPRLFDFCLGLHKKDRVAAELGLPCTLADARPFLHVSGMFPAERGCLALMLPLAMHPINKNELLAWDLAFDPSELAVLDVDTLRLRLFTRSDALPAGVARLPLKTVHLNKSPVVVSNLKTLSPARAERWGIDLQKAARHAQSARALPDLSALWEGVFARPAKSLTEPVDVDQDLYGGFVGNADRRRLERLRLLEPAELALSREGFDDPRLPELVFRYRARNFAQTLSELEARRWQQHCAGRLFDGNAGALTLVKLQECIDALSESADERAEAVLGALVDYAESIAPER